MTAATTEPTDDRAFLGHPKGLAYPGVHRGLGAVLLLRHDRAAGRST